MKPRVGLRRRKGLESSSDSSSDDNMSSVRSEKVEIIAPESEALRSNSGADSAHGQTSFVRHDGRAAPARNSVRAVGRGPPAAGEQQRAAESQAYLCDDGGGLERR